MASKTTATAPATKGSGLCLFRSNSLASATTATAATTTTTPPNTGSSSSSSSELASSTLCHKQSEAELRMVVLDKFSIFSSSKGLMFYDKRPSHFPPAIDVFLWGGLSARTRKVFCSYSEAWEGLYTVGGLILLFLWLFTMTGLICFCPPPDQLEQWAKFRIYVLGIAAGTLMVMILTVARGPTFSSFHRDMDYMVRELARHFQKIGYNITYEKQDRCFSHLAYIRFTPYTDINMSRVRDEGSTDNELTVCQDHERTHPLVRRIHQKRFFRVAVYGFSVYDDLNGESFINGRRHPKELEGLIDEFTWGAVSTEMRPFYLCRACRPRSGQCAMVTPVFIHVIGLTALTFVSSSFLVLIVSVIVLIICSACFIPLIMYFETWVTTCAESFLSYLLRLFQKDHGVLHQMEEKVKELAPFVEERSGYALHFLVESTIGYVCFEPRNESSFISSREPHDLDSSHFPEPMEHLDSSDPPEAIHDTINV